MTLAALPSLVPAHTMHTMHTMQTTQDADLTRITKRVHLFPASEGALQKRSSVTFDTRLERYMQASVGRDIDGGFVTGDRQVTRGRGTRGGTRGV